MAKIRVPLASYLLAECPDILASYGIGSCVVVALFDPVLKLAAMAHVMLPGRGKEKRDLPRAMYSDSAIEGMVDELLRCGSMRKRLVAKIAGGAQMFVFPSCSMENSPGWRNVETVMRKLTEEGIPLIAKDVGKNHGRSVEFSAESGRMLIKTISEGIKEI
jgi:chemotaxis protein CheD